MRKAAANFFSNSRVTRAMRMDSRECCSAVSASFSFAASQSGIEKTEAVQGLVIGAPSIAFSAHSIRPGSGLNQDGSGHMPSLTNDICIHILQPTSPAKRKSGNARTSLPPVSNGRAFIVMSTYTASMTLKMPMDTSI